MKRKAGGSTEKEARCERRERQRVREDRGEEKKMN